MKDRVIQNALDFAVQASKDLWDETLNEEQQLKYSTVHLYEGIELLLKARLMKEHWSLILTNPDKYKANSFEGGDFKSVAYEKARSRLEAYCGVILDDPAHHAFDALRKLRNKYVHFVCNESKTSVVAAQLKAWHYALRLLEEGFLDLLSEHKSILAAAKNEMLRSEEFIEARFDEIQQELEKANEDGRLVITCPTCEKSALVIEDGGPDCKVCKAEEVAPYGIADDYAVMNIRRWKKDGYEVAWCETCGEQACVPVEEMLSEKAYTIISRDIGEDYEPYICFACGDVAKDYFLKNCGYCGASYFDSIREEENGGRLCPQCGRL